MNLTEHYIINVLDEKPFYGAAVENNKYAKSEYTYVKLLVNCHDTEKEIEKVFGKDEWTRIKKQGYYLG